MITFKIRRVEKLWKKKGGGKGEEEKALKKEKLNEITR